MLHKKWESKTGPVECVGKWALALPLVEQYLPEPHYIETDTLKTHSGRELYWLFELERDTVLAFRFHEVSQELYVGVNRETKDLEKVLSKIIPMECIPVRGLMWE